MKVYVHYEPNDSQAVTYSYLLSSVETVESLLVWFSKNYESKIGIPLDPLCLELRTQYAERIEPFHMTLIDYLHPGDDVIIYSCPKRKSSSLASTISSVAISECQHTTTASSSSSISSQYVANPSNSFINSLEVTKSPDAVIVGKDIVTIRKEAEELFKAKKYRKAREFIETALKTLNAKDPILLYTISKIYYENNNSDKSVDYAERAVNALKSNRNISSKDVTMLRLHYAKTLFQSGQYEESDMEIDKFFDTIGGFDSAVKIKGETSNLAFEGLALHAECLFEMGRVSEAANVVNHGLAVPGAEDRPSLLRSYAYFALKYDKYEDAIRSLLKLIVIEKDNKRNRKLMSQALKYDGSVDLIYTQVSPSIQSAPAFFFLANVAKDYSMLKATVSFLQKCVSLLPNQPNNILSLVHALELTFDYDKAISSALSYWIKNRMMKIGSSGKGISGKALAEIIEEPPRELMALDWIVVKDPEGILSKNIEYARVFNPNTEPIDSTVTIPSEGSEDFDEIALDNIALVMSIVKILYLKGDFKTMIAIIGAFDSTLMLSKKPFHETNIRNENAYYSCIGHTLSKRVHTLPEALFHSSQSVSGSGSASSSASTIDTDSTIVRLSAAFSNPLQCPLFTTAVKNPIYLIGDSHIIPAAWAIVYVNHVPRLLIPKLVTGIKHWHLRNDSDFYPKTNFYNAVNSVPMGAEVIFVIGEIDCREGILVAVERDRYASISEGMTSTVKIFVTVLKQLINKRKLVAYIQPVLPMMEITLSLVSMYNTIYKQQIEALPGAYWLDLLPDITSSDGNGVKEELKLDGTHISPQYIPYLEKALNTTNKK